MSVTVETLRRRAINASLGSPLSLKETMARLGFVQADPIRSPARAQDLILRHRVPDYRAGDLERHYPELDLEEDYLYAYGFLPRENARLIHPRPVRKIDALANQVLRLALDLGSLHPKDLEAHLGAERAVNYWGGFSKATTRALELLHYQGFLRVSHRRTGIRIYAPALPRPEELDEDERLRRLALLIARILAPAPKSSLLATLRNLARCVKDPGKRKAVLPKLLRSGELEQSECDGVAYLSPSGYAIADDERPPEVRLLAPFDPIVWDRRRMEHFWNWAYRFEAYTPASKRIYGYYAMPMLWRDAIVGWANVSAESGKLAVETGFVERRPRGREFTSALDEEIERMKIFLGLAGRGRRKRSSLDGEQARDF